MDGKSNNRVLTRKIFVVLDSMSLTFCNIGDAILQRSYALAVIIRSQDSILNPVKKGDVSNAGKSFIIFFAPNISRSNNSNLRNNVIQLDCLYICLDIIVKEIPAMSLDWNLEILASMTVHVTNSILNNWSFIKKINTDP